MGFRISYLATTSKVEAIIETLSLSVVGRQVEMPYGHSWLAEFKKSGWTIGWFEDIKFVRSNLARIKTLSVRSPVVVGLVHETVMWSSAACFDDGAEVWSLSHQGNGANIYQLSQSGTLPASFDAIKRAQFDHQTKDNEVDYIFEIPLETAASYHHFRHDNYHNADDFGEFTIVKPNRRGLLSALFKQ